MATDDNPFASFVATVAALFAGSAWAQDGEPAEPAVGPAVAVLGEVDNHRVPVGDMLTVFDAYIAAKARQAADSENLLLVRCHADGVLTVRIDVRKMITTGDTSQNVMLRDGDLLFVPKRKAAALQGSAELVDVVVHEVRPEQRASAERARVAAWRLLMEKDPLRRHAFLTEFGKVAADGATVVEPLAAALERDVGIARDVATALGMLGAAGRPVLPALAKAMERGDAQLRERARAAVRQIERAIAAQKLADTDGRK